MPIPNPGDHAGGKIEKSDSVSLKK